MASIKKLSLISVELDQALEVLAVFPLKPMSRCLRALLYAALSQPKLPHASSGVVLRHWTGTLEACGQSLLAHRLPATSGKLLSVSGFQLSGDPSISLPPSRAVRVTMFKGMTGSDITVNRAMQMPYTKSGNEVWAQTMWFLLQSLKW